MTKLMRTGTMAKARREPQTLPSANAEKARIAFEANDRVRGVTRESRYTEDHRYVLSIKTPTSARWTVELGEAGSAPFERDGYVVVIGERFAFGARALARRYLSTLGVAAFSEAEVIAFRPNGHLPVRVSLVTADARNALVVEHFDFEALGR